MSEVLKDIAQTQQISKLGKNFKVVVILEGERMSKDAQQSLRRTMEKYSSNLRIVMICNTVSNVIDPIKSRCLCIRIPGFSVEEVSPSSCCHIVDASVH